jgi:2-polyprenyl-3-methyl-5-hydroxy-6-metoxy-1,4-benzoquinol methylase
MAEFSFPKFTPEVLSTNMLEAARGPKTVNATEPEQFAPPVAQLCVPLPVTKARSLLNQAREKAPPRGWRYLFRAIRRQPRVNDLIFRVMAELIKISRRSNSLIQGLHEQIDFARHQAVVIQERIRHVVQTDYEQQEDIASLKQTLAQIQSQYKEEVAALTRTMSENSLHELDRVQESLRNETRSLLETQGQILDQQHARLAAIIEQARERADSVAVEMSALQRQIASELSEIQARGLRADRSLQRLRRTRNPVEAIRPTTTSRAIAPEGEAQAAAEEKFDYFMFEQRFRGDITVIKQRQASYVDFFRRNKNVVDLGCGRGEFVELLMEHGIPATGIDMNEEMIESCQARGLKVVLADLFEYLGSRPDRSIGGIFSAQVIEHLSSDQIMRLVGLCGAKLIAGGLVVIETVNANCLYALGNFYLDPSHVKPVPCGLLQFMFEQVGFKIVETCFSGLVPEMEAEPVLRASGGGAPVNFEKYQDYAIIAVCPS